MSTSNIELDTFEQVVAQTTSLSPQDIVDIRAVYNLYSGGDTDLAPRTATHVLSLLGFKNEGQFPEAGGRVTFPQLLEEVGSHRRNALATDQQLKHCYFSELSGLSSHWPPQFAGCCVSTLLSTAGPISGSTAAA